MSSDTEEFKRRLENFRSGREDRYLQNCWNKCLHLLHTRESLVQECKSQLMRENSTISILNDFKNYEIHGREQALDWMDLEAITSKLLVEFTARDKIPILSEKDACDVLLRQKESRPLDFPTHCADVPLEDLEECDVMFEYWYWSFVAIGEIGMDKNLYCKVTIRSKNSNPYEMYALWELPFLLMAEETRYVYPLINNYKRINGPRSTCYHAQEDDYPCMLEGDRERYEFVGRTFPGYYQTVVINYKIFDSVIPIWVIKLCFDVLMQKLDFSSEVQNGTVVGVDPAMNKRRFKMMVEYFLKLPIHLSTEISFCRIVRARGIPRNCYFSNLIRTMSNMVITRILCGRIFRGNPFMTRFHHNKCVLVFASDAQLDLESFSACAETSFGIVVDQDRTGITANVEDFHSMGYCCDDDT